MKGRFNPSLHPRDRYGRFTRSFARLASKKDLRLARSVSLGFRAEKIDNPGAYLATLSGDKDAARGFLSGGFAKVNTMLRAGDERSPEVAALDKAMFPLPDDLLVTRKVSLSAFGHVDPAALNGFRVHDAGFVPVSVEPQEPDGDVLLRIQVPAGTPAAPDPDTGELVLDRDLDMVVSGVRSTDAGAEMALTVLPSEDAGQDASRSSERAFAVRLTTALDGDAARESTSTSFLDPDRPPPLRADEYEALNAYIGDNYRPINAQLRGGNSSAAVSNWIDNIDEVMMRSPLSEEIVTWRGFTGAQRIFGDRIDGDLSGMEWREDSYLSTSTDRNIAAEFAGTEVTGMNYRPVIMRMVTPAGVGAVEMSDDTYESEVLLDRGLTLRVAADRGIDEDGVRHLDVEVVPSGA